MLTKAIDDTCLLVHNTISRQSIYNNQPYENVWYFFSPIERMYAFYFEWLIIPFQLLS